MARQRRDVERKRRTRTHVLADLSVNHVERHALLRGYSAERVRMDYGIDLVVDTYGRRGVVENGRILFQLKATDRIKVVAGGGAVTCRVERAHLSYWLGEAMPVILVLYDARADRAYWLYVQAHFESRPDFDLAQAAKRVTVEIPRENVVDREAMRRFARYKKAVLSQQQGRIRHGD